MTSLSGSRGGCRCTHDHDCGDGKCVGYKKSFIWSTEGVCSGPAAPADCKNFEVEPHCCANLECEWKAGRCHGGVASWPERPHCDGKNEKNIGGSQTLLKANL